jgi:AcrR family transcriptional regulator
MKQVLGFGRGLAALKDMKQSDRKGKKSKNPKQRDAERSSSNILQAGMKHFSRLGYSGARVVDIIKDSGLSHRMLYHYYDNKEALYLATLEFAYRQIREAEHNLHTSSLDPVEGMRKIIEFTYDYFLGNPEFMALLSQENLNGGKFISEIKGMRDFQRPLIDSLEDLFARGTASGQFKHTYDPVQFYITISGLCYFGLSNRYTLASAFDKSILKPGYLSERRSHITNFVLQAITGN